MGKILVIAEKPSVARDIAKVIGATTKQEGYLVGEQYIVSWAIGHLVTLADPQEYDMKYHKWSMETLPILPEQMQLKAIPKTKKQLQILKKLMNGKDIDEIICATDSGREGELIFRYIYEFTNCKKKFRRLWISSMTEQSIREGFQNLQSGEAYDLLYHSARCRANADWLVGMNATRAYTLQYDALLTIGRVQTPTLALLVERQKEIDTFVPQTYYEVHANFGSFFGVWIDKTKQSKQQMRIDNQSQAQEIQSRTQGKCGHIDNIEIEQKKQLPPLLYDLTELQRMCNRKFGYSAQKTLDVAQSLYEKRKAITYPRTDSRYLSTDLVPKLSNILTVLAKQEKFSEYTKQLLSLERLRITKRIVDDQKISDHHAIIPTEKKCNLDTWSKEEQNVYFMIVGRFLAVFYDEYIYELTKVYTKIEQDIFLSKGKTVIQEGWTAVERNFVPESPKTKKEESEEEQTLPSLQQNQSVQAKNVEVKQKQTKPPTQYTESTLLSAMEHAGRTIEDETLREQMKESGLGTPATRAAIIEKLLSVGYVVRKGKLLFPTEKGINLIQIVPEQMRSAETTGKWEKGLSSIAKGRMSEQRFMESIQRYVQFLVTDATGEKKEVTFEKEQKYKKYQKTKQLGQCPLCKKGQILQHSKGYYCTQWKQGCTFTIWNSDVKAYGVTLTPKMIKTLLKQGKLEHVPIIFPQTKEHATATLILKSDKSGKIEFTNVHRQS